LPTRRSTHDQHGEGSISTPAPSSPAVASPTRR
jgi:hypothetical protein